MVLDDREDEPDDREDDLDDREDEPDAREDEPDEACTGVAMLVAKLKLSTPPPEGVVGADVVLRVVVACFSSLSLLPVIQFHIVENKPMIVSFLNRGAAGGLAAPHEIG